MRNRIAGGRGGIINVFRAVAHHEEHEGHEEWNLVSFRIVSNESGLQDNFDQYTIAQLARVAYPQ